MYIRKASTRKCLFGLLSFLAIGIGLYAFAFYSTIDGTRNSGFAEAKLDDALPELWYTMISLHAISAGTALIIGWLQFVRRIRRRNPNAHRMIGYLYSAGIVVGGITGLYVAWYADGGISGKIGFTVLALLWLYTLFRGLKSIIVDRNQVEHGRWFIRNYALTCAAIMLRVYTPLADGLFSMDTNQSFAVIGWLCWVPNLLLAEMLLSGRKPARQQTIRM